MYVYDGDNTYTIYSVGVGLVSYAFSSCGDIYGDGGDISN